jgi:hypothetical protein
MPHISEYPTNASRVGYPLEDTMMYALTDGWRAAWTAVMVKRIQVEIYETFEP